MKVRLTQQQQGTRNGQPWPAPGSVVDLPDAEAQALISGGAAADPSEDAEKVLVPPMGVHTPGRVAMPVDAPAPLVEAPADAVSDPEAAREAYLAARDGDWQEGPGGIAHQDRTGLAKTAEGIEKSAKAEQDTRKALGVEVLDVGDQPKAGQVGGKDTGQSTPAKSTPTKAADKS